MADGDGPAILLVAEPSERRARAEAALGELEEVVSVPDMTAALEELSLGQPVLAVLDGALPQEQIAWIMGAVGDPDRVVIWVPETDPGLFDYGAFIQIPYTAGERSLASAARRLIELQRTKRESDRRRDRVERYDHVMSVISDVRHEINSPLTSLLAEAELLLMDRDEYSEEQLRSLETIQAMAERMRGLMKRLQELDLRK